MKEKLIYFRKMFYFMKPYMIVYSIGIIFYGSQSGIATLINARINFNILFGIQMSDSGLVISGALLGFIMLLGFNFLFAAGRYMVYFAEAKAVMDLRLKLFKIFLRAEHSKQVHSGEALSIINNDIGTARDIYNSAIFNFLYNCLGIIISTVTLFVLDYRLGFAVIILGIVSFLIQNKYTNPLEKIGEEILEANADITKRLSDIFRGGNVIRAMNMQNHAFVGFDIHNNKLKFLSFKRAFISMFQNLFMTIQGWLSMVLSFGLGGWLIATGQIQFALLLSIKILAMNVATSSSHIGVSWANLAPPLIAAKRLFVIIDNAEETVEYGELKFEGYKIKIDNLNFKYPDSEEYVLKYINLEIKENETVAFIGESGSGKSTLLKAIIGMYEDDLPIMLGGLKLSRENVKQFRANFAYVGQEANLFDMTIAENIALGKGGNATNEEIIAVAKKAFAHDFIMELDQGYDTPCGEDGVFLSGGQKQRIAIARAFIRETKILVLDEVTSSLDKESESYINQAISNLKGEKTVLYITHDVDNIGSYDRIIRLENGSIA